MRRVIMLVIGIAAILAALSILGVGIASLVTVLNIQDRQNSELDETQPTVTPSTIPVPSPIEASDPRYEAYKSISDLFEHWMNTTIDPCDDFYSFSCGGDQAVQPGGSAYFSADSAITDSLLTQLRLPSSNFDKYPLPVRQMKWYYDACLIGSEEAEKAEHAREAFNRLREVNPEFGFPALYPKETKAATPEQLAAFLGYSIGITGVQSLVVFGVEIDWKNARNPNGGIAIVIDQPQTLYPSSVYETLHEVAKNEIIAGVEESIKAAAQLLGVDLIDQNQVRKDAQNIVQLDFELATKYSTIDATRPDYDRMYNPYIVDGLQKLAPFMNWKTFINQALTSISTTVHGSNRTIVLEWEKLALLSSDISSGEIPSRTLNNYLYLIALQSNYLPQIDELSKKSDHLNGLRNQPRRHRIVKTRHEPQSDLMEMADASDFPLTTEFLCVHHKGTAKTIWRGLQYANARLLVDINYPTLKDKETFKDQINLFVHPIVEAFRGQIDQLEWMTPASKKGAYQKLDNLIFNIGFPEWILNDETLTEYFEKLDLSENDTLLEATDKLTAFSMYDNFSPLLWGHPDARTDFYGPPAAVNAWNNRDLNSISLSVGMLQRPYFDLDYPAAMNYGSYGVIAGHELTHGFDDLGVQVDGYGVLNRWMDDNSSKGFDIMAQCVIDEYDKFCPFGEGLPCVNGASTQDENIADNGGIQAAYRAFKAQEALNGPDPRLPGFASAFTADQLFFLGFAQTKCFDQPPLDLLNSILYDGHSPSQYRLLGSLRNFPPFQKAFNCPVPSTYAPVEHCNVWT